MEYDEVIDFIKRRFENDCNWKNGNCYYFAIILKDRFNDGEIFYDVMDGHFIFCHNGTFYDWSGKINPTNYLINWNHFDEYDNLQKERILFEKGV